MNYQQFITAVKQKVAHSLDDNIKVYAHTTLKNNGKERIGLTISDSQVNIFPTIYLEEYYEQFCNGISIELISENVLDVYHEVKFEHEWNTDSIKDFSTIKSKITHKLIHAEKNRILLQTMPHVPYKELAIVFYILFEVDSNGTATIPVTQDLLTYWNTNVGEIYQLAMNNAPKLLPATFKPMRVAVEELLGNPCDDAVKETDIMFILSNPLRTFGASCILYNGILEQIACQLGENYYVLPSSIHETIIIPESQSPSKEHLLEMVIEINETQVEQEEYLSDNVYYYDFRKRELT